MEARRKKAEMRKREEEARKAEQPKTLMLKKAKEDLAQEAAERESAKRKYLEDVLPPLKLGGLSKDALESLCRDLHAQIEQAEEERFEAEYKVKKNDQEIEDLNMRIMSFTGRFKKPELKKVKVTPENMLNSLAESRRTKPGIIDFRANLKHVEREGHDSRRGSSSTTKSEGMEENLNGEED
ncbi:troponin I, slow skeletal muscle-like isoform X4 [Branchiostoma floridae]|uniref:Troponin I, slow skeletal muscle-like isoform X4 n=1 Tax=Branchiostoma floridae TaxID=7739 RepID=A0A9J7LKR6_BRAFL|nr:troponin I, slow skeletal muscle-like isoform X4 [Branchiostoma floridae]